MATLLNLTNSNNRKPQLQLQTQFELKWEKSTAEWKIFEKINRGYFLKSKFFQFIFTSKTINAFNVTKHTPDTNLKLFFCSVCFLINFSNLHNQVYNTHTFIDMYKIEIRQCSEGEGKRETSILPHMQPHIHTHTHTLTHVVLLCLTENPLLGHGYFKDFLEYTGNDAKVYNNTIEDNFGPFNIWTLIVQQSMNSQKYFGIV